MIPVVNAERSLSGPVGIYLPVWEENQEFVMTFYCSKPFGCKWVCLSICYCKMHHNNSPLRVERNSSYL